LTYLLALYTQQLRAIAQSSLPLMQALAAARGLGLASWCIGAGAVRNRVWDHLHGCAPQPHPRHRSPLHRSAHPQGLAAALAPPDRLRPL